MAAIESSNIKSGRPALIVGPEAQKRWKGERKPEIYQRLLDSAHGLFAERGYPATRTRDIAKAAGVATGTFYLYFDDKFDCFHAFAQDIIQDIAKTSTKRSLAASDLNGAIAATVQTYMRYATRMPAIYKAVTTRASVFSAGAASKPSPWNKQFVSDIEHWKSIGFISPRANSNLLSHLIAGAVIAGGLIITNDPGHNQEVERNLTKFLCGALRKVGELEGQKCTSGGSHKDKALEASTRLALSARREIEGSARKLETRKKIIAVARTMFAKNDYQDVTCESIAAAAQIGIGTYYLYFRDKLDCFVAVANQACDEIYDFGESKLQLGHNEAERMALWLRAQFEYSRENPGVMQIILTDVSSLAPNRPRSFARGTRQSIVKIARWKDAALISPTFNPRILMWLIAGVIGQGEYVLHDSASKRDDIITDIVGFIVRGVAE